MLRVALILMLIICVSARAATSVQFVLTDPQFGISKTANATVTIQAENIGQNGVVTLLSLRLQQITDTNGIATFTNLYGSSISGFYHWTVAVYNSSQRVNGDMWVSSTNLGTINEGIIDIVNGAPSYPAGTWCWSAQAADLRYQLNGVVYSNSFYPLFGNPSNYVQNATLLTASNALQSQIVSGAVTLLQVTNVVNGQTNGLATTNWVGQNFYPTSNPSLFVTASVTNGLETYNDATNQIQRTNTITIAAIGTLGSNVTNGYMQMSNTVYQSSTNAGNVQIGLLGTAVTNGYMASSNNLATANVVQSNTLTSLIYTNGVNDSNNAANLAFLSTNGMAIPTGIMAFWPSNIWLSLIQATNVITNNAWALTGNNSVSNNFIGTLNNNPLNIQVNGSRIAEFQWGGGGGSINLGIGNYVDVGQSNSAILSGTLNTLPNLFGIANYKGFNIIVGGTGNTNFGTHHGFIGNGQTNALTSNEFETIVNGVSNLVHSVSCGFIADGEQIIITGGHSFIGNGIVNASSAENGFIGTGNYNTVGFSDTSVINGLSNSVSGPSYSSTENGVLNKQNQVGTYGYIGTGNNNLITGSSSPVANYDSILDGQYNYISNAYACVVVGGYSNSVFGNGNVSVGNSLAFGRWIILSNSDNIVLAASGAVNTTTNDQIILSASNGVAINGALFLNGINIATLLSSNSFSVAAGNNVTVQTNGTVYTVNANSQTNNQTPIVYSNANQFVNQYGGATNTSIQGTLAVGGSTIYNAQTNDLSVTNCGSVQANGTYQFYASGSTYTNQNDIRFTIMFSSPTWFLQSNSTSLYQASTLTGTWSIVGGTPTPVPSVNVGGIESRVGIVGNTPRMVFGTNSPPLVIAPIGSQYVYFTNGLPQYILINTNGLSGWY